MENKEQKILSEIKSMMSTIRTQLELLDAKMAELQQCVDPEEFNNNPIELDIEDVMEAPVAVALVDAIDDLPFDDVPAEEPQQEETPVDEPVAAPVAEPVAVEPEVAPAPVQETVEPAESVVEVEPDVEAEPEVEAEPVVEEEPVVEPEQEDEPALEAEPEEPVLEAEPEEEPAVPVLETSVLQEEEDDDDDLPGIFDQPVPVYVAAQTSPKAKQSVADAMLAEKLAWRTDMPGSQVKDVRSAISLNDRIIFINYLFGEDPIAFQNAITKINTMTSLDEVVEYVKNEFSSWDLTSDLVYRFMMAVRRRVK